MDIKVKNINIPIYFGNLRIVVCDNLQSAAERLKVNTEGINLEYYGAFAYSDRNKKGYARYSIFLHQDTKPALIAHEAVHLTNFIFRDVCMQLDRINDEAQAYLTGWFVEQIHNAIKK